MEAGTDSERSLSEIRKIRERLKKTPFSERNIWFRDAVLISYPRSGLCWMRWMLWELRKLSQKIEGIEELNTSIPWHHDKTGIAVSRKYWNIEKIEKRKKHRWDHERKIILLARDPRDVISSNYRQIVIRYGRKREWPSLSNFLRDEVLGIKFLCKWLHWWIEVGSRKNPFMVQLYEDTRRNPENALRRIMGFVQAEIPDDRYFKMAADASTIDIMRDHETRNKNLFSDGESGLEIGIPEARMVGEGRTGNWGKWEESDRKFAYLIMNRDLPDSLKRKWL